MNTLSISPPGDAAARRRRLTRLSAFATWLSFAAAAAIVAACAYLWLADGALARHLTGAVDGVMVMPSPTTVTIAGAIAMAPFALLTAMLAELGRLFRLFAADRVFDAAVPACLGRVGWLAFSGGAAGILARTLVTLLMTSANPPGHRLLTIGADAQALASLIIGFLFLVFALVMQEALGLAEDNRSFV